MEYFVMGAVWMLLANRIETNKEFWSRNKMGGVVCVLMANLCGLLMVFFQR